jgi:hypothetical protein
MKQSRLSIIYKYFNDQYVDPEKGVCLDTILMAVNHQVCLLYLFHLLKENKDKEVDNIFIFHEACEAVYLIYNSNSPVLRINYKRLYEYEERKKELDDLCNKMLTMLYPNYGCCDDNTPNQPVLPVQTNIIPPYQYDVWLTYKSTFT